MRDRSAVWGPPRNPRTRERTVRATWKCGLRESGSERGAANPTWGCGPRKASGGHNSGPGPPGQAGYSGRTGAGADRGKPGQREQYAQAEPERTRVGPSLETQVLPFLMQGEHGAQQAAGERAGGLDGRAWRAAGPEGKAENADAGSHRLAATEDAEG